MLPFFEFDRIRIGNVSGVCGLHLLREFVSQNHRIDFIVVQRAAPIQVAGADAGPDAVDDCGFYVQHGAAPLVNLHAAFQQLRVVRAPRVEYRCRIGLARQNQPDVHAACFGIEQGLDQLRGQVQNRRWQCTPAFPRC